jgi:putative ABC transport system permease protein
MSALAVAFRSSRRNLRRHRGRNAMIAAMVSLPVSVMVAVGITHSSQQPTTSELLAAHLGNAQARIVQVAGPNVKVLQSPDNPDMPWSTEEDVTSAATRPLDPTIPGAATAVGLTPVQAQVATDTADLTFNGTVGAAWDPLLEGRYTLVDGRAPMNDTEVMLSPKAASRLGVTLGSPLSVDDHPVTYVGTLDQAQNAVEQIFIPDGIVDTANALSPTEWYVGGSALTWSQVWELNKQGMIAFSRDVVEHPPGFNPLGDMVTTNDSSIAAIVAIALGGGAIAVLLAGSAFAVGLRREQRVLGMFAVTGADRRHVAAVSIATGVWLGLMGGIVGVALGAGIAWGIQQAGSANVFGLWTTWGFHIPWVQLTGSLAFAVLVGAASAAIPAVMASRKDPLASLRGALRPHQVSRRWSVVGLAALVLGVAGLVAGQQGLTARNTSPDSWRTGTGMLWPLVITGSAIATFAGIVLVLPAILAAVARLAAHAPLSARLAARDGARQSMRTTGVIVAISVAVIAVTVTASLQGQSVHAQAARYQGWSPVGSLRVDLFNWRADSYVVDDGTPAVDAIRVVDPAASTTVLNVVPDAGFDWDLKDAAPTRFTVVVPEQNRCPIYHQMIEDGVDSERMSQAQVSKDVRCTQWEDLTNTSGAVGHVVVGGATELEQLLGRPGSAKSLSTLEQGGAVLLSPAYLDGSSVTFGVWDQAAGNVPNSLESVPNHTVTLPAVVDAPRSSPFVPFAVVISPETAAAHDMQPVPSVLLATTPGGFTQEQADAVAAALHQTGNLQAVYTPGPKPDVNLQLIALLAVGLLILTIAAAAISIGIARADARNDDSTLMSVGAAPSITRLIAMWQALLTVALAALSGIGIGLAVAWALSPLEPAASFVVPTGLVVFVAFGLPALMGLGALVFTRPARVTAYRLAA